MANTFGVEFEIEGFPLIKNNLKYWAIKEDGSLRKQFKESNPMFIGAELTFNQGYFFEESVLALRELKDVIEALRNSLYPSNRCSVHVHVGAINEGDITGILLKYLVMEKTMYSIAGASRYYNNFCIPLTLHIPFVFRGYENLKLYLSTYDRGRYMGLNVLSYDTLGTLEFRQFRSVLNTNRIQEWITIINNLVNYPFDLDVLRSTDRSLAMAKEILPKKFYGIIDIKHMAYINKLMELYVPVQKEAV